ncbi:hypothetical protein C8J55DRAFT_426702, partial [Lentinula edodes]
ATLQRHCKGGSSKSATNSAKGLLTKSEAQIVINYCLEMARQGFPLAHEHLKKEVDSILCSQLGDAFLQSGVGKQ